MTKNELTRRDFARLTVAGAAGTLLPAAAAHAQAAPPRPEGPTEGETLAQLVAMDVGYPLTDTQAREVASALKGYPGAFAAARAYHIPNDIEPAWTPYAPPVPPRKGRNK